MMVDGEVLIQARHDMVRPWHRCLHFSCLPPTVSDCGCASAS